MAADLRYAGGVKAIPPALSLFLIAALAVAVAVQTATIGGLRSQLATRDQQTSAHEQEAQKASEEIARVRQQNEIFKTESETLRQHLTAVAPGSVPKSLTAASMTPVETASAAPESSAPGKDAEGNGAAGMMKNMAKMLKDPEMKKMMRAQQGMGIRMMYGDLTKELGLSPEEQDAVMDLLTDRQLAMSAKGMEMMGGDGKMDPAKMEEMGKATTASNEEFNAKIKEAVGADRFTKFQDFEKTVGDRFLLQQGAPQFAASGAPLQDAQRDGLLRIMSEERTNSPAAALQPNSTDPAAQMRAMESDEGMHAMLASQEDYNRRVLQRAGEVLSPEQLASFKTIQANWAEMMQMGMKMSREMVKGK